MFDTLLNWLGAAFNLLWEMISSFADGFWKLVNLNLLMFVTIAGAIVSSLYTAYSLMSSALGWLDTAATQANGVGVAAAQPGGMIAWLNYVFPINEIAAFLGVWMEVAMAIAIYRFFKRWVPSFI